MIYQDRFSVNTQGRSTVDVTREVANIVRDANIESGICQVFLQHTSASLIFCENADPAVRSDLERFISRLVKDGDAIFEHTQEGPDDMSAHVRTVLTGESVSFPVSNGEPAFGVWQGIYLWEHRSHPHNRSIVVTVLS
ncbi:MAG: secondary thiamine-phosphate synthase enzyme YjbQ [Pseudomonadota bacterium]